ncbi:hypothetical protein CXB51_033400 [Gossypium anomalum]|uniref:Uncharacterized protein n=1 Tax=Gossypium anomalum TaxID=47600 RepID=A0A8J6CQQ7_9ROSI|nr:hypothetical protein CXB51_033400 [Gossypium anomalum]
MGLAQAMKRIPRIKFPQRHPKPSDSGLQAQVASKTGDGDLTFFSSSKAPATVGGKASLQPKRTPVSNEEIEAILVCNPSSFMMLITNLAYKRSFGQNLVLNSTSSYETVVH